MNWTSVENAIQAWVVSGSGLDADHVIWAEQGGPRPNTPFITLGMTSLGKNGQDWQSHEDQYLTIADDEVESVDDGADTLTLTAHGLFDGDGPIRFATTGTLPAGLAVDTDYFVIYVDDDTIKVASTFLYAMAGTSIDLTDTGSGTHTLVDTSETVRAGEEIKHYARGTRELALSIQCFADDATGINRAMAILSNVESAIGLPTVHSALRTGSVGVSRFDPITPISGVKGASEWEPRATLSAYIFLTSEVSESSTYIATAEIEREVVP